MSRGSMSLSGHCCRPIDKKPRMFALLSGHAGFVHSEAEASHLVASNSDLFK
jgi:hypothetical protein